MKRTGQSCLSNFAAVQTCCVVTVRQPQTKYFQYCPFVLVFFAKLALFQNPGRRVQRCLKLSCMKTLLYPDLTGKTTALLRTESSRLWHCRRVWFIRTAVVLASQKTCRYPELLIWSQTAAQGKQTGGFNTVKNISAFSFLLKKTIISKHYRFYL